MCTFDALQVGVAQEREMMEDLLRALPAAPSASHEMS